jgi:hypothetical protein
MVEEVTVARGLFGFCDMSCRYAENPKTEGIDGAGSCRTFVALYCSKKKLLVHKNIPCGKRQPREEKADQS